MKIEEAIEILYHTSHPEGIVLHPDYVKAHQLGIEALKRLAFNRLGTIASSDELLPGETEELRKGDKMTLEEAIEIGEKVASYEIPCWMPKALKAQRLGIEAFKAIKHSRQLHGISLFNPLPGETK